MQRRFYIETGEGIDGYPQGISLGFTFIDERKGRGETHTSKEVCYGFYVHFFMERNEARETHTHKGYATGFMFISVSTETNQRRIQGDTP